MKANESRTIILGRKEKLARRQELAAANLLKCKTKSTQLDSVINDMKQKVEAAQERLEQSTAKKTAYDVKVARLKDELTMLDKKISKYTDMLSTLPEDGKGEKKDAESASPVRVPPQLL